PAELLAEPDVPRPLQPHPRRRLGALPPPPPCRQLPQLPLHPLPPPVPPRPTTPRPSLSRTSASIHVSSPGSSPWRPRNTGNPSSPAKYSTNSSSRVTKVSCNGVPSSSVISSVQDMVRV